MKRERFMRVMRREEEGYIPYEFCFCKAFYEKFQRNTKAKDYFEYYDVPVRFVMPEYIGNSDYTSFFDNAYELKIDQWGIGHKPGRLAHFTQIISPLKNAETIDDIKKFPFVDPVKDYDWDGFTKEVKDLKNRDIIVYGALATTVFEVSWQLIGFEKFMMALHDDLPIANYLMDKIIEIRKEFARRYAQIGVDCLHLGDDVSTQLNMMMSVKMWREKIKPRLKQVIDEARCIKSDILMDYHGDGNLQSIIPDLIEIGIDILNPVQPECMNPYEIKHKYGDRLSFRGALGTQTTLPFGTVDEVRNTCEKLCSELGKGGGFMLCPTHMIEPEVPWENFEAYIDVLKSYNKENNKY